MRPDVMRIGVALQRLALRLQRPLPSEPKRDGVKAGMRRRRPAGLLATGPLVTAIAWLACGAGARAQYLPSPTGGLLPPTGVDTRVGDLRGYFSQAFGQVGAPEAATRSWTYTASVDASETYDTDA